MIRSYRIVRKGEDRFACKDCEEGHIIGADYDNVDEAYRESCKLLRKMNVQFYLTVPVEYYV